MATITDDLKRDFPVGSTTTLHVYNGKEFTKVKVKVVKVHRNWTISVECQDGETRRYGMGCFLIEKKS